MNNKYIRHIFSTAILFICFACNNAPKEAKSQQTAVKTPQIIIPTFNKEKAYDYVAAQVAFGPRTPESKAHQLCSEYLVNTLKEFTPNVIVQEFKTRLPSKKVLNGKNIIASFQPEKKSRVLLCAHWDSRPFADQEEDETKHNTAIDGANDGASGVGVLLEIARILSSQDSKVGIDIIFFDIEDSGVSGTNESWALGAQYWSKNPHIPNYTARFGILLDMVGTNNPTFKYEMTSYSYAPHILKKVWNTAKTLGYQQYFLKKMSGGILDDHVYINEDRNIPTIDIIHYDGSTSSGFFEHWHTLKDDMSSINPNTLEMVGKTVLKVIYEER